MKPAVWLGSLAAGSCPGLSAPVWDVQPANTGTPTDSAAGDIVVAASQPADAS